MNLIGQCTLYTELYTENTHTHSNCTTAAKKVVKYNKNHEKCNKGNLTENYLILTGTNVNVSTILVEKPVIIAVQGIIKKAGNLQQPLAQISVNVSHAERQVLL